MGRKLFRSHLAQTTPLIDDGIHDVRSADEGIITFTYVHPTSPFHKANIQACATDLGEYPDGNSFMLCTDDDIPHPIIPKTLQRLTNSAHGKSVIELLCAVAETLSVAISANSSLDGTPDDSSEEVAQDEDEFGFDFENDSDNEFFGPTDRKPSVRGRVDDFVLGSGKCDEAGEAEMAKIRADLNALKNSGFRVGVFGNLTSSGILCASIRIPKLGLSDEALEAWSIPRKRYLVLLIRYSRGYRDATKVADDKELSTSVQMRVGLCQHYKPSLRHALGVFQLMDPDNAPSKEDADGAVKDNYPLEPLFIGKALNQFLEERLFKIVHARELFRLTWLGAEKFISERQASASSDNVFDLKPYYCDDAVHAKNLPSIVMADHMRQGPLSQASLPLLIMQFVLRHFVRCTEFCLVCHCRVDDSFEALKPYVCLKPLCLFQYLALGFGPSLEWEILTQPYVVDLLVSFCYAAAHNGRLKELPVGMNLTVPVLDHAQGADFVGYPGYAQAHMANVSTPPGTAQGPAFEESFTCTWDGASTYFELMEDEEVKTAPTKNSNPEWKKAAAEKAARKKAAFKSLRAGDWLFHKTNADVSHCQVKKIEISRISFHQAFSNPQEGKSLATSVTTKGTKSPIVVQCYL